jgi:RNA polymerase sigma-70 factor (ECF subfamily)
MMQPTQRESLFQEIMAGQIDSIYRICLAYLYNRSHAEDLQQEILLQIWKSLPAFRGEAALSTWVYRIAVNTAITYNIKQKKGEMLPLLEAHIEVKGHSNTETNAKELLLEQMHFCISQLGNDDRILLSLVLEDLSYKQIAEISGISLTNTGVRIKRVKEKLLRLMEKNNVENGL